MPIRTTLITTVQFIMIAGNNTPVASVVNGNGNPASTGQGKSGSPSLGAVLPTALIIGLGTGASPVAVAAQRN